MTIKNILSPELDKSFLIREPYCNSVFPSQSGSGLRDRQEVTVGAISSMLALPLISPDSMELWRRKKGVVISSGESVP